MYLTAFSHWVPRRQEAGALGHSEPCVLYVPTLQVRVFVFLLFLVNPAKKRVSLKTNAIHII